MLQRCTIVITQVAAVRWQLLATPAASTITHPHVGSSTSSHGWGALSHPPCVSQPYNSSAMPPNAMDMIKQLRQATGAPVADVKSSLASADWDLDKALEVLRLKGKAAAVKKASRHASEGLVAVAQLGDAQAVSVVEINSETDFVGRSGPFQQLATAAARAAVSLLPQGTSGAPQVHELDVQQLAAASLEGGSSVQEGCELLAGQVRENIALRRGYLVTAGPNGVVASYVHMPVAVGAGRIAAVVALDASGHEVQQELRSQLSQLGSRLAMHCAGMNTQHISKQSISQDVLQAVRADFASATEAQMPGKAAEVLAKIVDGRVAKWCKEVCLLDQKYVLDDSMTVSQLLEQQTQQLGLLKTLQVSALLRVQVGEGLLRREENPGFAAEVAAMAAGGSI